MAKAENEFHSKLINKIKSWKDTADFGLGKTDPQKLSRSLSLLSATDPEVLVHVLGITELPNDPAAAMNLVRNMDISTLKSLEIFTDLGGDKLVGHHELAAGTIGTHLRGMEPGDRYDVFKGLKDLGERHGMDPRGIRTILTSTHKSVAHGGDFSGKKTGALLDVIPGESGVDFLKRFTPTIQLQKGMSETAAALPQNQDWNAAMRGASEGLGTPDLSDPTIDPNFRKGATSVLKKSSPDVLKIVGENTDNPAQIQELVKNLTSQLSPTKRQLSMLQNLGVNFSNYGKGIKNLSIGGLIPGIGFAFDASDAVAKHEKASKPDANWLDKLQSRIAKTTAATSLVPEPITQLYNAGSGAVNSAIDIIRDPTSSNFLTQNRNILSMRK
jgi:hypothetical protein